ncbi:hypothetical protein MRX96_048042 [Rhipicephalus microplus]
MSVYCRPSQCMYEFDRIVRQAKRLAGTRPLLLLGDFITPHTTRGHKFQSKRGESVDQTDGDHELALLNEPDVTIRRGNSVARDTTLELTWLWGIQVITWTKEDVYLGSDPSMIGITIRGYRRRVVMRKARITNGNRMTKFTQEQEEASEEESKPSEREQTYTQMDEGPGEGPKKVHPKNRNDVTDTICRC